MAIRVLPIQSGVPAFTFRTDLDNVTYEFRFTFNDRAGYWTMDIFSEAGDELLRGVPIFVNQLLLEQYQYKQELPQGSLFALNLSSEYSQPTDENFGEQVILLYEEA